MPFASHRGYEKVFALLRVAVVPVGAAPGISRGALVAMVDVLAGLKSRAEKRCEEQAIHR